MATGADWMSAASFIGMAGTLYLHGYGGLAFIMGWTGGYCLVALFLAPYLRKFGQFTIPDFLGERYGGNLPRFLGIIAAILCSFTYVVAQIYGVGLITARLSGLAFEIGIFVGLGGILVCSFLGGMRAVTWTQVAQYIILIVAYMIPVVWLSVKQTGVPIPQAVLATSSRRSPQPRRSCWTTRRRRKSSRSSRQRADDLACQAEGRAGRAGGRQGSATKAELEELKAANAPLRRSRRPKRRLRRCPRARRRRKTAWTQGQGRQRSARQAACRHAAPRPGSSPATRTATRQRRRSFDDVAPQLPGAGVLPDGRARPRCRTS